jgi:hypothetical protein
MNDIYANDPTPPISEQQKQELSASLDSAGSAVPLRPSDLHTRTMVPRIREQMAKWVPQGPPWKDPSLLSRCGYPAPMVDLAVSRQ